MANSKSAQIRDFYHKGLCGLANLGNTCFMNATLQSLSNCIPLTGFILSKQFTDYESDSKEYQLLVSYHNMLADLWKENSVVKPVKFHKIFQRIAHGWGRDEFLGFGQKDAHEFLVFLLEIMHQAIARKVFRMACDLWMVRLEVRR